MSLWGEGQTSRWRSTSSQTFLKVLFILGLFFFLLNLPYIYIYMFFFLGYTRLFAHTHCNSNTRINGETTESIRPDREPDTAYQKTNPLVPPRWFFFIFHPFLLLLFLPVVFTSTITQSLQRHLQEKCILIHKTRESLDSNLSSLWSYFVTYIFNILDVHYYYYNYYYYSVVVAQYFYMCCLY